MTFDPPSGAPGWVPPPGAHGPPLPPPPGFAPFGVTPPKRKRFGWAAVILAFLGGGVMATIVLIAGLVLVATNLPDSVSGVAGPIAEGQEAARVGDCLSATPAGVDVTTREQVVDCERPHGSEVMAVIDAPDAPSYPGRGTWAQFADGVCPLAFFAYVGVDDDDSLIEWRAIIPTEAAWDAGDRGVWCLADSRGYRNGSDSVRGVGGD